MNSPEGDITGSEKNLITRIQEFRDMIEPKPEQEA
jgi:hypothetical protein